MQTEVSCNDVSTFYTTYIMSSPRNTNPGNFANRPKEEVREIARKGGQSSHTGGFASMDPEKQHAIASKGGHASSGKFQKGSERAREAARKAGHMRGQQEQRTE